MNNERVLYIQPIGGIAGDMFVGACLDSGLIDSEEMLAALDGIVDTKAFEVVREKRAAIKGRRFKTHLIEGAHDSKVPGVHRKLGDVLTLINKGHLKPGALVRAEAMFRLLAEAEAEAHDSTPEEVHFHEVGFLDSIADICCAAFCLDKIGATRVICTEVPLGSGVIDFAHSRMPVPGPAVLLLLRDVPTCQGELEMEMTTPTGAAILQHAVTEWGPYPEMKVHSIGYGHGHKDTGRWPNTTRIVVGEAESSQLQRDTVQQLCFTVDDMQPEWIPLTIERLLAEGCLDACVTTVFGKKGRPGFSFTVLCRPEDSERIIRWILANTTTIGLRCFRVERRKLNREPRMLTVDGIPIRLKYIADPSGRTVARHTIEADSLAAYCRSTGHPPHRATERIEATLRQHIEQQDAETEE